MSLSSLLEKTHLIPNLDYRLLLQVIQAICVDKSDLLEAFRRICFNVFYGNRDDHGGNFAFLYDEELHGYSLSPAFDITKTLDKPEHEMTVNGRGHPTEEDLMDVARIMKLPQYECQRMLNETRELIAEE